MLALVLSSAQPLRALFRFALGSPLYSYILLVPFLGCALLLARSERGSAAALIKRRHELLHARQLVCVASTSVSEAA